MYSELKKALQSVSERTGIEVFLFSSEGKFLFSPAGGTLKISPRPFQGVLQDERCGCTLFKIAFRGEDFICAIRGAGAVEKNYAALLSEVIENYAGKALNIPKGEFVRRILLGECGSADIQTFRIKYSLPDLPCFALAISFDTRASEMISLLSQYATGEYDCAAIVAGKNCAFIKFMGEDSEYQSSADFASFLARSLLEEVGVRVRIGVGGTVRHFDEIASSYRQADTALRMSEVFKSKGDVHTYREFVLTKMLEDIPEAKLGEYFSILLEGDAKELLKDEDMVNTAEEFLENNLNVSETSRNLYMHRNTLMYRLDKIERVTGLNLRNFTDAVTFRVITILSKLI
ncbi:MAG TPA: helix-turn-helix domain-containing protein [Candidatus Borkfalkia excrementavium]|uniref:Helix-turn-helix domain-containing protein n=1 Tax=Candidatus Borkfalkia excrementavium TaxID=2838505 RepID=A0A9D1Z9X7_9FIRM|nr:helix-turn-helix domain-containing protein [Candidatus Borkfalkia excrementavium]